LEKCGNEEIAKNFIESILGTKIKELSLDVNKELLGEILESKMGIVDIKAKTEDGTKIVIEMQKMKYEYIINRVLLYWARVYGEGIHKNNNYSNENLPKTIIILIVDYNLEETKEKKKYHTKYGAYEMISIDEEDYWERIRISDKLEVHIIELRKFKLSKDKEKDNWIRFIKAKGEEDMAKIVTKNNLLEKAKREYKYLSSHPELRKEFEAKEIALLDTISMLTWHEEKGEKRGEKRGEKMGEKKNEKKIVLNMYAQKVKKSDISKFVGISEERVQEIIAESINKHSTKK
jgi:predicted transposase/invertase (TIGR01784 family)